MPEHTDAHTDSQTGVAIRRYPFRVQYHFRHSPRGLLGWDVHRLVALAENLNLLVIRVPLSEIRELDETYWFGSARASSAMSTENSGQSTPTCRAVAEHSRLIHEADLAYPVILCSGGQVMDGMHRICKALLLGHESIAAVRFTEDPEPDYVGVAPNDLPY